LVRHHASAGVFTPSTNDIRTRSMHRVELHKHLSQTNLRAPQGDKEVRRLVSPSQDAARPLRVGLTVPLPPALPP
jgi:hypothetical protein